MNAFFDAAVILLLFGIALGHPESGGAPAAAVSVAAVPAAAWLAAAPAAAWLAAAPACWFAVVTPALVRSDFARRRLPDALTLPAVGLVVASAAGTLLVGGGGRDPAPALLGLGLVVAIGIIGAAGAHLGGVGLGDVKLAAGLAGSTALVDVGALPIAAFVAAGSGAVAAAVVLRRGVGPPTLPYGPCLLAGYWCGLLSARLPDALGLGSIA